MAKRAPQPKPRTLRNPERLEARELMASDMVLQWNEHLREVLKDYNPFPGPGWATRNSAMVSVAVYDAVNAITQKYNTFATNLTAPSTASKEAAVATAAHDVAVAVYPDAKTVLDTYYQQSLDSIPDGTAENDGIAIGRAVAAEILNLRAADRAADPPTYTPGTAPGQWRPDPLNPNQSAVGPHWGTVTPFTLNSPTDINMPAHPAMNSAAYTASYNEVKSLGAKYSTTRTADQTEIGIFWAYDRPGLGTPVRLYNQVAAKIAEQKGNTLEDNARLFALLNLAMADSGVVAWNTKYTYHFWRPITAIREGASDGNAATTGDPTWVPLGSPGGGVVPDFTPAFPAYTSGHSTFGEATFRTLANFYGSDYYNFSLTSEELPGVTRNYTRFSQASDENGRSRIYLGVHWNFDDSNGRASGRAIADHIHKNFLQKATPGGASIGMQLTGGGYMTAQMGAGAANLTLRRSGGALQVVNNAGQIVLLSRNLDRVNNVRFNAGNGYSDMLTIDHGFGGSFYLPSGVRYNGRASDGDRFWYAGTSGNDGVILTGGTSLLLPAGLVTTLRNVSYLGLAGHGGNDSFSVQGDLGGRRVDLLGHAGDDTYVLGATNGSFQVNDSAGTDTIDFRSASHGVKADLQNTYRQSIGGGNALSFVGQLENVYGSQYADVIKGNAANNSIWGEGGDDLLNGRAGNDNLYGQAGHDVLVGGLGDDCLYGGDGNDLLFGGGGRDKLYGEGNENILLGGLSSFDENDVALLALMAEWSSPTSWQTRYNNLRNVTPSPTRKNGSHFLTSTTVRNDLAVDELNGNTSANWLWPHSGDVVR